MLPSELHYWPLTEVAARIRRREVSASEVTRSMLQRIEEVDRTLQSFALVTVEAAQEAAERADADLARGIVRGPLHGVPLAHKDLFDTAGLPTTAGGVVRDEDLPDQDATVVARLRSAGAISLGKLKLSEGAFADHHPTIAAPVNPWGAETWAGASSSGSGVAVAGGLCFGALGTDTGGSIRFPSHVNGTVGLKPTYGRVSRHGVFPLAPSMDHVGPLTRTVGDAAAIYSVIAGFDPQDPTSLRQPVESVQLTGSGAVGLRIGFAEGYVTDDVDTEVVDALAGAIEVLGGLGARIRDVEMPPVQSLLDGWPVACAVETALAHETTFPSRADEYGPQLRGVIETGQSLMATDVARVQHARAEFTGRLRDIFDQVDVLAIPVMVAAGPTIEQINEALADGPGTSRLLRFTAPFDMSGSPSLTLPCGRTESGMPIGFQLVGPHLSEALLCQVGHTYQSVTDWHTTHPRLTDAG